MKIFINLLYFNIFVQYHTAEECLSKNIIKNNEKISIKNFKKFNELSFNCTDPLQISEIEIKPNEKQILDDTLNLTGLTIKPSDMFFEIKLKNLKGFNFESNPFKTLKLINYTNEILWGISTSDLKFFFGNILIDDNCSPSLLEQDFSQNFLSFFNLINFKDSRFSEFIPLYI